MDGSVPCSVISFVYIESFDFNSGFYGFSFNVSFDLLTFINKQLMDEEMSIIIGILTRQVVIDKSKESQL